MKRELKVLIFLLVIVSILGFLYFREVEKQNKIEAEIIEKETAIQSLKINSFGGLNLLAKSAVVFDPNNNETLFSFHENKNLPLASIAKIMTAEVALENMPENTIVTIDQKAISEEGDNNLLISERWTLKSLIRFMLTASSNDAAKAISLTYDSSESGTFIDLMNKKAKELNMEKTIFYNESGLDLDENHTGAYSSANDVVTMMQNFYENHEDIIISIQKPEIIIQSESGVNHTIKNTNILLANDSSIRASKTGFTDLAGGNLAVIFEAKKGYNLIAVILGSTYDGRFNDMSKLMAASRKYLNNVIQN